MKRELNILLVLMGVASCATASSVPTQHVVKNSDAPIHAIAGGKARAQLFLNESTGSARAALTYLVLDPGAAVPSHIHP